MIENTTVPDMAVRKATFDRILRIFSEHQPQIQLVVGFDAAAARDKVGNFRPVTLGPKTHWNLESLYLKEDTKTKDVKVR